MKKTYILNIGHFVECSKKNKKKQLKNILDCSEPSGLVDCAAYFTYKYGYRLHFINTDTAYQYRTYRYCYRYYLVQKICEKLLKISSYFITAEL